MKPHKTTYIESFANYDHTVVPTIAAELKKGNAVAFVYENWNLLRIQPIEIGVSEIDGVPSIEVSYGTYVFTGVSPDVETIQSAQHNFSSQEYFKHNDYVLASCAFVFRMNNTTPQQSTNLGLPQLQIVTDYKHNNPLQKAKQELLVTWGSARGQGEPEQERTRAISAMIQTIDNLEANPIQKKAEEDWKPEVLKVLKEKGQMAAIKLYHHKSGVGLREAQAAVLRMKEDSQSSAS
jgi:hypothetical protein